MQELLQEPSSQSGIQPANPPISIYQLLMKSQSRNQQKDIIIGKLKKQLQDAKSANGLSTRNLTKSAIDKVIITCSNLDQQMTQKKDRLNVTIELQNKRLYEDQFREKEAKITSEAAKKVKQMENKLLESIAYQKQLIQKNNSLELEKANILVSRTVSESLAPFEKTILQAQSQNEKTKKDNQQYSKESKNKIDNIKKQFNDYKNTSERKIDQMNKANKSNQQNNQILLYAANPIKAIRLFKKLEQEFKSQAITKLTELISINLNDSKTLTELLSGRDLEVKVEAAIQSISSEFKNVRLDKIKAQAETQKVKRSYQTQLNEQTKRCSSLQENIKTEKSNYARLSNESSEALRKNNVQLQQLKRSLQQLKNIHASLEASTAQSAAESEQTIKDLTNSVDTLTSEKANLLTQLQKVKKDLQTQKRLSREKEDKSTTEKEHLKRQLNSLKQAYSELEKEKKRIENEKLKIQIEKEKLEKEKEYQAASHKKSVEEYEKQLKQLKDKIIDLEDKIQKIKQKATRKEQELNSIITNLQQENRNLQSSLNRTEMKLNNTEMKLNNTEKQLALLEKYKEAFQLTNDKFLPEFTYMLGKQKFCMDIDNLNKSQKELLQWSQNQIQKMRLFSDSEIIDKDSIEFILRETKSFMSNIAETKLIFRYDPRIQNNFHQFIDGKENLFLVVKMINGVIIGGFSVYPLEQKVTQETAKKIGSGKGFLMNLTLLKTFPMKAEPSMPILSYDAFFFIFGNSQIRLKILQNQIYSNFGIPTSTFDPRNCQRSQFLGVNDNKDNTVKIIGYEFYQLRKGQ